MLSHFTVKRPVSLLFLSLLIGSTQCSTKKEILPVIVPAETIFFDDFSNNSLDRSKWNVFETGYIVNNELQGYIDSAATLYFTSGAEEGAENGALVLQPLFFKDYLTKDGQHFDFVSSRINTQGKFDFTYGYASARIKITPAKGFWPAWWMLGNGDWPATGEIDIMEYVGEDWVSAAMHGGGYSGNTPFAARKDFLNGATVNDWHVYSVLWTKTLIDFSVDGQSYYKVSRAEVEAKGAWAFDSPKHLILNFALGGDYPAGVNGVTTPYHGLPEASLQLVKEGKCKMFVDWVKITTN